ncbi:MAG: hypothetical protein LQ340_005142 [Diploschistes diacapsis]|nr:MAG: hypothetical protein LQ340_005142 [Diploschistes diacapsis]
MEEEPYNGLPRHVQFITFPEDVCIDEKFLAGNQRSSAPLYKTDISKFVTDIQIDPATRGVTDVAHTVVAAASSNGSSRASEFLQGMRCPSSAKAYGNYQDLAADSNVDAIYVATPHSHHYQNVMLCLEHGKHVLCEKAFTVNAAQTEKLVQVAREKKLFLMEAVWTRYFPLSIQIRKAIEAGEIGKVHRTFADLSLCKDVEKDFGTTHRMVNMDLAGGALLDLGIYSLTWVFQTLYHTLPASQRKAPTSVQSLITKYPKTGADEMTSILLSFPSGPAGAPYAHGIATTNLRVAADPDGRGSAGAAIRIQGTKGEIQVDHPAYRPTTWRIVRNAAVASEGKGRSLVEEHVVEMPGGGRGFMYEADEVARCIKEGKLESETLGWEESVVIMRVMDEVRRQNGLVYPEKLETLDYPIPHW